MSINFGHAGIYSIDIRGWIPLPSPAPGRIVRQHNCHTEEDQSRDGRGQDHKAGYLNDHYGDEPGHFPVPVGPDNRTYQEQGRQDQEKSADRRVRGDRGDGRAKGRDEDIFRVDTNGSPESGERTKPEDKLPDKLSEFFAMRIILRDDTRVDRERGPAGAGYLIRDGPAIVPPDRYRRRSLPETASVP
jgi:hypothetical protein